MEVNAKREYLKGVIQDTLGKVPNKDRTTIRISCSKHVKEAIDLEARLSNRTTSNWVRNVLMEELHRLEYL